MGGPRFVGGQLSSWNRLCFQGGYLGVRRLPGAPGDSGLWPAVWTLGNLARDLYPSGMSGGEKAGRSCDACAWPTPGTMYGGGAAQRVTACEVPAPSTGFRGYQGRGAPEMDLLELMTCPTADVEGLGVPLPPNASCLFQGTQVAPRLPPAYRPWPNGNAGA